GAQAHLRPRADVESDNGCRYNVHRDGIPFRLTPDDGPLPAVYAGTAGGRAVLPAVRERDAAARGRSRRKAREGEAAPSEAAEEGGRRCGVAARRIVRGLHLVDLGARAEAGAISPAQPGTDARSLQA